MLADRMTILHSSQKPFEVVIPDEKECTDCRVQYRNDLCRFTDGTGAEGGVYSEIPSVSILVSLGRYTTEILADIFRIIN